MFTSIKSALSGLMLASMLALLPGGCPVTEDAADEIVPPVAGAQQTAPAPAAPAPPPAPRVLLTRTFTVLEFLQQRRDGLEQFSPSEVGKKITVRLAGDATGSRVRMQVRDGSGDLVINENNPLSNETEAEFISNSTAEHTVVALEFGSVSALYTLIVTEE